MLENTNSVLTQTLLFGNMSPANIRLDEDVLKTSFVLVLRRRLQDVSIKTNIFTLLIRLQKTSWSRPIYLSWSYVFKTSSRRLQDIFNTSSRRFQDVLKTFSKRLQDIFKTSSGHLQDVFKTFWRPLQDVFKTYHQVKLFLLTRFEVIKNVYSDLPKINTGWISNNWRSFLA